MRTGFLDRRRFVYDLCVVQQQRSPGLGHREAQPRRAIGFEHARLAALDVGTAEQHHRHQVDAVAVRAFGRRAADAVRGVDAEGMCLAVPALRTAQRLMIRYRAW